MNCSCHFTTAKCRIRFHVYKILGGYPALPSCDFINIISGGELCPYCCAKVHDIFKHHLGGIQNFDFNIIKYYVAQYT